MTVHKKQKTRIHWNYFLALEEDMERVSRYIEFDQKNLETYSIELAHLLLASSSEVDVILKEICQIVDPTEDVGNICEYRECMKSKLPQFLSDDFIKETVYVPRYNLDFQPWLNWNNDESPEWWKSYNKVKHERNMHFLKANLQNALNSLGALMITTNYYYWFREIKDINKMTKIEAENSKRNAIRGIKPEPRFLKLEEDYYPIHLIA